MFAALALVVTIAGISGVIAISVTHRLEEFGVRMALGATRPQILNQVIAQGLRLVAVGLAAGIALSFAATKVLSAYLYRHQAHRSRDAGAGLRRVPRRRRRLVPRPGVARHLGRPAQGAARRLTSISFPRGFAPRTPRHAPSLAAAPARSGRVARSLALARDGDGQSMR